MQVKFYCYKKGGRNGFSHAEEGGGGWDPKGLEVVLTQEPEVLAIVMEGGG